MSRSLQRSVRATPFISRGFGIARISFNQQGKSPEEPSELTGKRQYKFSQPLSRASEEALNKRIEMVERAKAVILGILALAGILGGYELYNNRAKVKYYLYYDHDLSGFNDSYKKITDKGPKPTKESFIPTNPNSSSVPGLYIVGRNDQKQLINNDEKVIKVFQRNPWFDDKLLKKVRIGSSSSCAIDSKGDLIQWGDGFKKDSDPQFTLKGERLSDLVISNGVLYLLNQKGELLYFPENYKAQQDFKSSSLLGLKSHISKKIPGKFDQIKSGKEHLLLLSKDKKVYTMATGLSPLQKSFGQFGLPIYTQYDAPPKVNELLELTNLNYFSDPKSKSLRKRNFEAIASGDFHNLAVDEFGSIWSWGINTFGSLGHDITYNTETIPIPKKIEVTKSYFKRNELPHCTNIQAGGFASFGTFKSSDIYNIFQEYVKKNDGNVSALSLDDEDQGKTLHLSWGKCLEGQLGVGRYIHCQSSPLKMKNVSDLTFYNEDSGKTELIGIKDWSIGSKHLIVTLDNNDVLSFGDNEFHQLGDNKRVKAPSPKSIPKLVEPVGIEQENIKLKKSLQLINDRLQLQSTNFVNTKGKKIPKVEQKIYAGDEASAIYYSPM